MCPKCNASGSYFDTSSHYICLNVTSHEAPPSKRNYSKIDNVIKFKTIQLEKCWNSYSVHYYYYYTILYYTTTC